MKSNNYLRKVQIFKYGLRIPETCLIIIRASDYFKNQDFIKIKIIYTYATGNDEKHISTSTNIIYLAELYRCAGRVPKWETDTQTHMTKHCTCLHDKMLPQLHSFS